MTMRRVRRPSRFVFNEGKRFMSNCGPFCDVSRESQRLMFATKDEVARLERRIEQVWNGYAEICNAMCASDRTLIVDVHGIRRYAGVVHKAAQALEGLAIHIEGSSTDAEKGLPF